jgi:hypothetical protein
MNEQSPLTYTAYILRLWIDDDSWRASLKDARSGKQHNFASIEQLNEFLLANTTDIQPESKS